MHNKLYALFVILSLSLITLPLSAQDTDTTPSIRVSDQLISGTSVVIDEIFAPTFGLAVVRADDGEGNPATVLGIALIHGGINPDVRVELDMINITSTLHVMVHNDTEPYEEFQFDSNPDADPPVMVDEEILTASFDVVVLSVHDQFVDPDNFNRIVVDFAVASLEDNAWIVAHSDDNGALGNVLGHTFITEGASSNMPLLLQGAVTDNVHITLHIDDGNLEQFEYPSDDVDTPLTLNDEIIIVTIATVPTVRADDQLVIGSDLTRNDNETVPYVIDSVLSNGAGWLVVHADDGSSNASAVIGIAPVQDGFNDNVIVQVTQTEVTPILFPMLHIDTGVEQVYEFGDVPDADLPARYNDQLVIASSRVLPSINDATITTNTLSVASVIMDVNGWLVVYAIDDNGMMGEIITQEPLHAGLNQIDNLALPDNTPKDLLLMLHYDTRPVGYFTFSSDEESDPPVIFSGEVITAQVSR